MAAIKVPSKLADLVDFFTTFVGANDGPARGVDPSFDQYLAGPGRNIVFPTGFPGLDIVEPSKLSDDRAPFFAAADGTGGYEHVVCACPFYKTNTTYENPCLFVSHDLETMIPVVYSGGVGTPTPGYGNTVTDAAITNGQKTLTSATAGFTPGMVGWSVIVEGAGTAGPNGTALITTITGYTNSTTVTLNNAATATVAGANAGIGLATPVVGPASQSPAVAGSDQGDGAFSDPSLVWGPDGKFSIVYNQFLNPIGSGGTGSGNDWSIKVVSSSSLASGWSAPVTKVVTTLSSVRPSSPAPVFNPESNSWDVYCIDLANISAGAVSRYTVAAGKSLTGAWTLQTAPAITMPAGFGRASVADGAIASGTNTLACIASTPFTAAMVGWQVTVVGAGAAGADLHTTIGSVTDSGHAVLAANAATIVVGTNVYFGQTWWHLNALRLGKQLLLLIQDSPVGTSGAGNIWPVWSRDLAATWTVPQQPLMPGTYYRGAVSSIDTGSGMGLDILYGATRSGNWQLNRTLALGVGARYRVPATGRDLAALVAAARVPLAPWIVGDGPIRADASTPGTADSGQAWTVYSGGMTISGHDFVPQTNGSNNKIGIVAAGAADCVVAGELKTLPAAGHYAYLMGRVLDANNFAQFGIRDYSDGTGYHYEVQNVGVGGATKFATVAPQPGDILVMVMQDSQVDCYVNGNKIGTVTYSGGKTNSGVGLRSDSTATHFRNLAFGSLAPGGGGSTGGSALPSFDVYAANYPAVADVPFNGHKGTGAAAATAAGDLVRYEQVVNAVAGHVAGGLGGATAATRYVGATAAGAPPSGTFAKGDWINDWAGNVWICVTAGTPGTWTCATKSRMQLGHEAAGILVENVFPYMCSADTQPVSQTVYGALMGLRAGDQVNGIVLRSGQAAVGAGLPTHARVGIADSTGKILARSNDLTAAASWPLGGIALPLSSAYVIPADGGYYACFVVNGTWTTPVTLARQSNGFPSHSTAFNGAAPPGFSWTGQTDLPAVNSLLTLTAGASIGFYMGFY